MCFCCVLIRFETIYSYNVISTTNKFVCLFICLVVCLFVDLFVCLFVCLFVDLFVWVCGLFVCFVLYDCILVREGGEGEGEG